MLILLYNLHSRSISITIEKVVYEYTSSVAKKLQKNFKYVKKMMQQPAYDEFRPE